MQPLQATELFPEKRVLPFEGLYLSQDILDAAEKLSRPFVCTNYVCDLDEVIAVKDESGKFRIPNELRNPADWRLFKELEAQADIVITGGAYLRRLKSLGKEKAEDLLGGYGEEDKSRSLEEWRLADGYTTKYPAVAVVTRTLDFDLPDPVHEQGAVIFTTYKAAESPRAERFKEAGFVVVGSGDDGVDARIMIDYLRVEVNARSIEMVTGPSVLSLLLDAGLLDRIYISRVGRNLAAQETELLRIFPKGPRLSTRTDFSLVHEFVLEKTAMDDGAQVEEHFLRYDRK